MVQHHGELPDHGYRKFWGRKILSDGSLAIKMTNSSLSLVIDQSNRVLNVMNEADFAAKDIWYL